MDQFDVNNLISYNKSSPSDTIRQLNLGKFNLSLGHLDPSSYSDTEEPSVSSILSSADSEASYDDFEPFAGINFLGSFNYDLAKENDPGIFKSYEQSLYENYEKNFKDSLKSEDVGDYSSLIETLGDAKEIRLPSELLKEVIHHPNTDFHIYSNNTSSRISLLESINED
jgi:hypothetical protein